MNTYLMVFLALLTVALIAFGIWAVVMAKRHQRMPKLVAGLVATICVLVIITVTTLIQQGYNLEKTATEVADASKIAAEAIRVKHEVKENLAEAKAAVKAVADVPKQLEKLDAEIQRRFEKNSSNHMILDQNTQALGERVAKLELEIARRNQSGWTITDGAILQPQSQAPPTFIPPPTIIPPPVQRSAPRQDNSRLEGVITKLSEQVGKLNTRMDKMENHVAASDENLNQTLIKMSGDKLGDRMVITTSMRSPKPLFRTLAIWPDSSSKDITYVVKIRLLKPVSEVDTDAFVKRVAVSFNKRRGGHYAYQNPSRERVLADFANDFHHTFAGEVEREARFTGAFFIESATFIVNGQAGGGGAATNGTPAPVLATQ